MLQEPAKLAMTRANRGRRQQPRRPANGVLWIANLEQECARLTRSIGELQRELEKQGGLARTLDAELNEKSGLGRRSKATWRKLAEN